MLNSIIRYSVKNKLIIGLFTIALIIGGIWSLKEVPVDAVPDITNNQVQVITQSPNLSTEDIEQFVTYPVEVAMANLPGVSEIRSVSRFGLSVVTIVFEEDMGTYVPRQLVSEKLNDIGKNIPEGFGEPEMGPISTGLGEIYQYTLEVDSTYKDEYSITELRTIQDWIIRRQMAMVPGVVEVNAFGGKVKQYEVAVATDELNAIGLTITDIFNALEQNNQNTGGAYIEKDHYANFIRGEGLARNLDDIRKTVVVNKNGLPITIGDIAKVRFGEAVRYGAFTKDGQGEAVGGMILMLKGANSNDVIERVKERIIQIQQTLPPGVHIESFLDRSTLIKDTTSTVSKNLLEGALIVIFVLVLLLGNWRGGLIVASAIPLSLLFAFILMNIFGVWANLMSLGAIDFGIIVDGAVIIVESTVFLLHEKIIKKKIINQQLHDELAYDASSKMMNSAFFGQLIILIVFIPILALEGVEGKMFQPMALTFMFAMIGVMVLCLTYIPMMSALFLRVNNTDTKSWGDKIVAKIERVYESLLRKTLKKSKLVIILSVCLLGAAGFAFSKLGGEFIPQLDEGDIAFHVILKPGSSLSEAIESSTKIEQLLLEKFPEVEHAMTRFGVADVPTDPMPMDIGDCFIILKPKDEWVTTDSKEELIHKIKQAVSVIPGINYEFTQPIEMRFNELLSGVREDVAVKLFGEDLDILADKAEEMGRIISTVPGVGDMKVEATSGLPQMTVRYDRVKLAQYGLKINELNKIIMSAFSGGKAGVIFEGEKRFDLVVRLQEQGRKNIDDVKTLYIPTPNNNQIPLKEVADISYVPGPMQISRDNTNRRIYVGINVRNRDVKSLVEDIKNKLDNELQLPPGYYIRYGGAFENLERASKRLQIVVPIALALIFTLVFFALKSISQTVMIYMAIPLAAIGGIFSLWLRDMPFSISAGVGFIVLFGVAVLNGLVLINGWNELKDEGKTNIYERIILGAKRRIRPIMLTAFTDVLGFLPMAISTSAGAEVQQPLATVVIGGMISATLLTLFVMPVLYNWLENRKNNKHKNSPRAIVIVACILSTSIPFSASAQEKSVREITSVKEAIEVAIKNNGNIKAAETDIQIQEQKKKVAFDVAKTQLGFQYGQYNSFENDLSFNVVQNFDFPSVYINQHALAKKRIEKSNISLNVEKNELKKEIRKTWYTLAYLREQQKLLLYQDTLYKRFLYAATIRYETEESTFLEKSSVETEVMEVENQIRINHSEIFIQEQKLKVLLNATVDINFNTESLKKRVSLTVDRNSLPVDNPTNKYVKQQIEIAETEKKLKTSEMLPGFSIGYFNQSLIGSPTSSGDIATINNRFTGIQAGVTIPLFFGSYTAQIKEAKLAEQMAQTRADYFEVRLFSSVKQQLQEVYKQEASLDYYNDKALKQADLLIEYAQKSFENGAIGYIEYFRNLNQAIDIKSGYLKTLNTYNQSIIVLEYFFGK
ncbi:MAG: CusA/CzcA family heavy metal efflux RND transporter [Chitinophagales bacterium]|nr:CusA/CzcA family heavy metal efflux RND transporter [Chitinophagales bacterium]